MFQDSGGKSRWMSVSSSQPGLYSKFLDSQGFIVRPWTVSQTTTTPIQKENPKINFLLRALQRNYMHLFPRTTWQFSIISNSSSRGSDTFWPARGSGTHIVPIHICRQGTIHISINYLSINSRKTAFCQDFCIFTLSG